MASADLATSVLAAAKIAAAKAGLPFYESHEKALIAWIEPIVNGDIKSVMDAGAAHLTLNGFASVMQTPARNAITGTETTVAAILDSHLEGAAAWFDGWLKSIAAGPPA